MTDEHKDNGRVKSKVSESMVKVLVDGDFTKRMENESPEVTPMRERTPLAAVVNISELGQEDE